MNTYYSVDKHGNGNVLKLCTFQLFSTKLKQNMNLDVANVWQWSESGFVTIISSSFQSFLAISNKYCFKSNETISNP